MEKFWGFVGRRFWPELRRRLYDQQKGLCWICGVKCNRPTKTPRHHPLDFTLDHIIPVSEGGTDDRSNFVGACKRCNRERGSTPWHQVRRTSFAVEMPESATA